MLVLTSGYNLYHGQDAKLVPEQSTQYVFRYSISAKGAVRVQTLQVPNSFGGIAWEPDRKGFIVGGGVDDAVYLFTREGSQFEASGKIPLGHKKGLGAGVKPQAAGVAVSPDGQRALVANYYNDSVSLVDLARERVVAERDLRPGKIDPAQSGVPGGEFPFAVAWTGVQSAWLSSPRDRQLVSLSITRDGIEVAKRVRTIGEPTALLVDSKRRRLIATEDNDDRLAFINLASGRRVAEPRLTLPSALAAGPLGKGLNPNGLATLPDGRLLITLGGINAVALMSPGTSGDSVRALIPTGWYPSAVAASADGGRVFVVNRKSPPGPNPEGCSPALSSYHGQPKACSAANQYIFQLEKAGLLQFPMPRERALAATTLQVAENIGLPGASERAAADAGGAPPRGPRKQVVVNNKENPTNETPGLVKMGEDLANELHKASLNQ
jgi:DNA-binding beta-propeller fold protein YncE